MRWVNKLERTICYRKKQIDVRFSCVCPVIDIAFDIKLSLKVGSLRIHSVFASLIHSYFDNVKSELINNPWPSEHRAGALPTELRELEEIKVI